MFGKLIGKIIAAPVRIINLPVQVISKAVDSSMGMNQNIRIKDRDPVALEELAQAIEKIADDE
jgi:hypothetical protein